MSTTVADIVTNLNTFIGDASTDRVSAADRLQYITEATIWLQESLENQTQNKTYAFSYYDTVHYYKITNSLSDLLEGADLRRQERDQFYTFAHKSGREMAEEIGQRFMESSWAIERADGEKYLVVNHDSKYVANTIVDCESLTSGGGLWAADTVTSDATNLTIDSNEFKAGNASFNFDVDVSQSVNNRATISNSTLSVVDLSSYEDLASWVFWIYVPDVTHFSSITLYWGTNSTNYWSATSTSDLNGASWVNGWNRVSIPWQGSVATGTPVSSTFGYLRFDYNFTVAQTDDTDYRLDDVKIIRPEPLTFYYISWDVGTATDGVTAKTAFTATTDIPYFSGQYDQYKYAVAHKAASLVYNTFRLEQESSQELVEAARALQRAKGIIPSSKNAEVKSFKIRGNNLTRTRSRRQFRG